MTNRVLCRCPLSERHTLTLIHGDITEERVDAIVNAANEWLKHGGGLAGFLVRKGGRIIQEESDAWVRAHGPITPENPAHTSAGRLPAQYIIHAVGPRWGEGDEPRKLRAAVQGALRRAQELGLQSIALPAISTGVFGYPVDQAAPVILQAIRDAVAEGLVPDVTDIRVVLYDANSAQTFVRAAQALGLLSSEA